MPRGFPKLVQLVKTAEGLDESDRLAILEEVTWTRQRQREERKKDKRKIRFDMMTRCYAHSYFLDELLPGFVSEFMVGEGDRRKSKHQDRRSPWAALIMGDLKQFKLVNDHLGHDVGDAVIKTIGKILRRSVRFKQGDDFPARVGGDETVVLLTGLNLYEEAEQIALRYKIAVENMSWEALDPRLVDIYKPCVDLGISCVSLASLARAKDQREIAQKWYVTSDKLMYRAKHEGGPILRCYEWTSAGFKEIAEPDPRRMRLLQEKRRMKAP